MYEEKRFIKRKINWFSVFLKVLLLFLVIFLIWFLIFGRKTSNKPAKKGQSMEDNLKNYKKDSVKYFTEDKLPKDIGEVKKVTLEEMIKDKATKEIIDKNGNKCSTKSSYSQVTKVEDNNYTLKVYIKCKNEADSVLTTISTGKKKTTTKTNNNKTTNNTKNTNNNNNTNSNTNTNNSTNTKKTNTKTSSSSTTKTTKETSIVEVKSNTNTNTNSNSNNNTTVAANTNTNTNTTTQTSTTQEFVPTKDNLLYTEYELIKYGEWTTTKPESGRYKVQKLSVVVNKYCYGSDKYNCHTIPKTDKYKDEIDFLLKQGYTEIYDHTNSTYVYLPYETIWSKTKDVEGYTYTGNYRDVHKMS